MPPYYYYLLFLLHWSVIDCSFYTFAFCKWFLSECLDSLRSNFTHGSPFIVTFVPLWLYFNRYFKFLQRSPAIHLKLFPWPLWNRSQPERRVRQTVTRPRQFHEWVLSTPPFHWSLTWNERREKTNWPDSVKKKKTPFSISRDLILSEEEKADSAWCFESRPCLPVDHCLPPGISIEWLWPPSISRCR